ncbi:PIN_GEN1 domain containing protein [Azospirillum argentinense]|uniref:Uncharacterized protein n=1 Tax=Azospirillum argentinense TaxID=2970906 RepID=A0A5B0L0W2_9PROT|nr:PIN_GEN1 domain containing protein [Azospirillum argentinense]
MHKNALEVGVCVRTMRERHGRRSNFAISDAAARDVRRSRFPAISWRMT